MRRPTEHELTYAVQRVLWNANNHVNPASVLGRDIGPQVRKVVASLNELFNELEGESRG